jgi:hypothetical protein
MKVISQFAKPHKRLLRTGDMIVDEEGAVFIMITMLPVSTGIKRSNSIWNLT